jgi:hypothetical protein
MGNHCKKSKWPRFTVVANSHNRLFSMRNVSHLQLVIFSSRHADNTSRRQIVWEAGRTACIREIEIIAAHAFLAMPSRIVRKDRHTPAQLFSSALGRMACALF